MNYIYHLSIFLEIYLVLSLSLNLLVGYTGLLTLAHGAFFGIGAYITALSLTSGNGNFVGAVLLAVVGTAFLAALLGIASLHFTGEHFLLMSLAFQILLTAVLRNWNGVTHGPLGITSIPRPHVLNFRLDSQMEFFIFATVISGIVIVVLIRICRSPFGRALRAIRDNELAMVGLGKPVVSLKLQTMTIASACAAVAGSLYACYVSFVDPTGFNIDESIVILSMVVIGGAGNVLGPALGAILLTLLPEFLRLVLPSSNAVGNVRMLIYGMSMIVLMRFRPQGIAGEYQLD
jgi:branched-chain amino acid transport system permease protein